MHHNFILVKFEAFFLLEKWTFINDYQPNKREEKTLKTQGVLLNPKQIWQKRLLPYCSIEKHELNENDGMSKK